VSAAGDLACKPGQIYTRRLTPSAVLEETADYTLHQILRLRRRFFDCTN